MFRRARCMGWRNRSGKTRAEGSEREREEEMKKSFSTKKRIAMAAGLLVVAIGASAAFAYWTASGTGSGDATAGSDSGVKIQNVDFDGTLYLASNLSDKSVRGMTTLSIAEQCLKDLPPPPKPKPAKTAPSKPN